MPPSPDGGESPGKKSTSLSPAAFKFCIVLATLALVCAAVGFYFLYYTENRTHGSLGHAMLHIRTHMTRYNEAYKTMSDQQLLEEGKRLSDELANVNGLSILLEHRINFCRQKIKEGWVPFKGQLYFFTLATGFHSDAQKDCQKRNAVLAYITSIPEEDFLEEMVYRRGAPHWLGLQRISTQWVWENAFGIQGSQAQPQMNIKSVLN
ncbi:uncharacterized protein LOC143819539 isoform X2 [Paroedura picta]|uniref:uncharacterized protein LOC143819539 isoform X2 n=1 Tax=Paroedura picta TaxID=143630 RepID=UPI004055C0F9